mgnify:CR=1 FL=1
MRNKSNYERTIKINMSSFGRKLEKYIKCLFIPHDYMSVFFCRPIMTIHVCDEAKNCKFLGVISYLVLNILENENFVVFSIITL